MVIKILRDEQEIVFNNIKANIVGWSDLMIDTPDFYLVKCNFGVLSLSDIDGTHVIVASASESNDINSFILKFNDNDIEESSKKLIKLKNGLYLSVEDGYFEFNKKKIDKRTLPPKLSLLTYQHKLGTSQHHFF